MTVNITHLRTNRIVIELPDDILADAARMFLPDVLGLDLKAMCERAIREMRDDGRSLSRAIPIEKAKWRAGDPVWIANHVMMFIEPQLAGFQQHHAWHTRLLKLRAEREQRVFGAINE